MAVVQNIDTARCHTILHVRKEKVCFWESKEVQLRKIMVLLRQLTEVNPARHQTTTIQLPPCSRWPHDLSNVIWILKAGDNWNSWGKRLLHAKNSSLVELRSPHVSEEFHFWSVFWQCDCGLFTFSKSVSNRKIIISINKCSGKYSQNTEAKKASLGLKSFPG